MGCATSPLALPCADTQTGSPMRKVASMGADTVVADVADELARRVAAGQYRPGELMPSVRQVAEEIEMNRATAQLNLGRLESYWFVSARRGQGVTIHHLRCVCGPYVVLRLLP